MSRPLFCGRVFIEVQILCRKVNKRRALMLLSASLYCDANPNLTEDYLVSLRTLNPHDHNVQ